MISLAAVTLMCLGRSCDFFGGFFGSLLSAEYFLSLGIIIALPSPTPVSLRPASTA